MNVEHEQVTALPIKSTDVERMIAVRRRVFASLLALREQFDEAAEAVAQYTDCSPRMKVSSGIADLDTWRKSFEDDLARALDCVFWSRLMEESQIGTVMDQKTRDEFQKLTYYDDPKSRDLPPFTEENIGATMQDLVNNAEELFGRCIESVFRALSWDHKTNEPQRMKERMILTGCTPWYLGNGSKAMLRPSSGLRDLEKVLLRLDGQAPPDNNTGLASLYEMRTGEWYDVPGTTGPSVMRVKAHKKGTLHVHVERVDLLAEMNRIASQRFGMALGRKRA